MAYSYQTERPKLFTDEGQQMFLAVRDNANRLLASAGAVRMDKAIGVVTGDSWQMLACVDRMVELGELRELTNIPVSPYVAGQYRVFVATSS